LEEFGKAIRQQRKGGPIYDRFELERAADRAWDQVGDAVDKIFDGGLRNRSPDLRAIARETGLSPSQVAELAANPKDKARVAYAVAGAPMGLSYDRFRKLMPQPRRRRR
jgi:hypothetical protein